MIDLKTINGSTYIVIRLGFNLWHSLQMRLRYGSKHHKLINDVLNDIKKFDLWAYDEYFELFDLIYYKKAIIIHPNIFKVSDVKYFKLNVYRYFIITLDEKHGILENIEHFILRNMFGYPYTE